MSLDTNFDPAGAVRPRRTWLRGADVLLPNATEAVRLAAALGGAGRDGDDVAAAAAALSAAGPVVVVKRGAEGALVAQDGACRAVPAVPAPAIVDAVGAGDAFDAGFIRGTARRARAARRRGPGLRVRRALAARGRRRGPGHAGGGARTRGRRMIACAAPSPSIDKLFSTSALTPGAIHRPDALVADAGGKGLNVARAARALGCRRARRGARRRSRRAVDRGRLDEAGVAAELVWGEGETRTSLSVAAGGRADRVLRARRAARPGGVGALPGPRRAVAPEDGWVAVCGSLPVGVAPEESGRLVAPRPRAGARVAVDQRDAMLAASLDAGPELVKVNAREAAELTGGAAPEAAAAALRQRVLDAGAVDPVVAVTLGERGALLLAGAEPVDRTLDLRAPYPVGSGDAFLAGLLAAAPPPGGSWQDALALALGSGAANAEVPGAGSLDPARARTLAAAAGSR